MKPLFAVGDRVVILARRGTVKSIIPVPLVDDLRDLVGPLYIVELDSADLIPESLLTSEEEFDAEPPRNAE